MQKGVGRLRLIPFYFRLFTRGGAETRRRGDAEAQRRGENVSKHIFSCWQRELEQCESKEPAAQTLSPRLRASACSNPSLRTHTDFTEKRFSLLRLMF